MPNKYRFVDSLQRIAPYIGMLFFAVFPRLLISPLLLRICASFSISYDLGTTFFLFASIGFSSGLLLSGYIAHRINHQNTITVGAVTTGIALVCAALVSKVWLFQGCMLVMGFANGLYHGSGISRVTEIVPLTHRTRALSFHETGSMVAFVLAPIISAAAAPYVSWRGLLSITGAVTILAALLFRRKRDTEGGYGTAPKLANIRRFSRIPAYWIILSLMIITHALLLGVFAVLPTFLELKHGLSESFLNSLIGISKTVGLGMVFIAGMLADRYGTRRVMSFILIFTGVFTVVLGTAGGNLLILAVLLQPMLSQTFFPAAIATMSSIVPDDVRNLALSLAIPITTFMGGGVTPAILGAMQEIDAGFIGLGIAAILAPLILFALPKATTRPER